ncbi:MAG TPA: hypothetical protein VFL07_08510 [Rudaea sp.]|jgi:hypothetical protein|nr:hypothetical protein [Rudaea sp.]
MATTANVSRGAGERRFFAWGAAVIVLVAFGGFARTYYLKLAFDTPALTTLVHAHALVMTAWVLLFVTQTRLVAAQRTDLHRRLGVFGVLLLVLIVAIGVETAIASARRGLTPTDMPPLMFLVIPLGTVVVFAVLAGAAVLYRRRSDIHKRLMLLATLTILTPAIARIPWEPFRAMGPPLFLAVTDTCVLAFVAYDTWKNRRLHPALLWGTLFFLVSQPLRMMLAHTAAWTQFATWLTS